MKFTIKILESDRKIQQDILKALIQDVSAHMVGGLTKLKKELPNLLNNSIINSDEYTSLVNGQLKYDFGIANASTKIAGLINIWLDNTQYDYKPPRIVGGQIKSSLSVSMIRADFSDVLKTDFALVVDNERGYSLPWLKWLLLDGTMPLVNNYDVTLGPNKRSRTGFAVMTPSTRSWSVISAFAGTVDDNWITRAIANSSSAIESLIEEAMK